MKPGPAWISRLWPRSLLGQMLLAVAIALLIAQSISAVLLFRAADVRRDTAVLNAIAFRLVGHNQAERRAERLGNRDRGERRRGRPIGQRRDQGEFPLVLRVEESPTSPAIEGGKRLAALEGDLKDILEREGLAISDIVVLRRIAREDPFIRQRPRLLRRVANSPSPDIALLVVGIRGDNGTGWQVARAFKPGPQRGALATIVFQTLVIYIVMVGLHFLLLRRITRPLAALTSRTEQFGTAGYQQEPLPQAGPQDIRQLIAAHNAMEMRIGALLDEKDVMLGAIGHDLKTPLAALRVRIENVENETDRAKMAHSIEDISQTLDDILSLARIGRPSDPPEKAELTSLVSSVVEEFEDLGQPVTMATSATAPGRVIADVRVIWLRRALRNLIENALRYAGTARTGIDQSADGTVFWVEDDGPGVPPARMDTIMEPFTRGEASRNRQTGGAGLGLTLARAIAQQHGGTLTLTNRAEGGLRAEIRLPPNPL